LCQVNNAKIVLAINKDQEALAFQDADFALVADLFLAVL
jgi:electron transfer flavoprotein alpha subunit